MKIFKNKFAKLILVILAVALLSVIAVGCFGGSGEKGKCFLNKDGQKDDSSW